jgi:hypothetical protein
MSPSSRRNFLLTAAAAFIAGCQQSSQRTVSAMPQIDWPDVGTRPTPGGGSYVPKNPPAGSPKPAPAVALGKLQVMPRTSWSSDPYPVRGREIHPLAGANRITIHHEGWKVVDFTDTASTMERLNQIRNAHVGRGWADIGYHFVIDRSGKVWEGRSLRYQGAHVKENNEHNIGVMVLGNFDEQSPTTAQINSLRETVRALRTANKVSERSIFTHQEITSTACPGRSLQPKINQLRSSRAFA